MSQREGFDEDPRSLSLLLRLEAADCGVYIENALRASLMGSERLKTVIGTR